MKPNTSLRTTGIVLLSLASGFAQPMITSQPQGRSVSLGVNVTFTVVASGLGLTYQWQFKGADIGRQTNASLLVSVVEFANAGHYAVVVTDGFGDSIASQPAFLEVDPTFTKITTGPIVTDVAMSWDGTWADYDGDDFLDLFVGNATGGRSLYRNNGNGTFTKVTNGPVVTDIGGTQSGSWGDYDNDGFPDLFAQGGGNDHFYHNNGDGSFTNITSGPLVNDQKRDPGAIWVDFNNDGHLDLFTTALFPDNTCSLYRNNGDGSFTPVTGHILVTESGEFSFAEWADYDNDGWPDAFVSKFSRENNALYHNSGNGSFTRIYDGSIVNDGGTSVGCGWADYDNDGCFDLFVANGGRNSSEFNFLYHNNGDGTFTKVTGDPIVSDQGHWGGCSWGDYDNDGLIDLFVADELSNNALYHNNGDGTFTKIPTGSLVNDGGLSFGCAWGDYDNDGFLDLFVANGRGETAQNNFLYRNSGNSNAWLKVKLVGTRSNRSGIGAKVRISASIGGRTVRQLRQIAGGNGAGGQSTLLAHFGLGKATNIDTVRIEWPSGIVQELHNLAARQFLTITEPPRLSATGIRTFQFRSWTGMRFVVEASPNLANWTPLSTVTNTTGTVSFTDSDVANYAQRFYRVLPLGP